jgi:transposase
LVGSDDHAGSAGNLLGLVASAGLRRLSPRAHLRDLFRVLPHWPRDRSLEDVPKCWAMNRARLDPRGLAELGHFTVPPPATPHDEKAAANRPP